LTRSLSGNFGNRIAESSSIHPDYYWSDVLRQYDPATSVIVIPDSGCTKKIHLHSSSLQNDGRFFPVVQGEKTRDTKTNKLTGFKVFGDVKGKTCIILDDICDGGGTFVGLGQVLIENGATELVLAVSHGIMSRTVDALSNFSRVHITDSFIIPDNLRLSLCSQRPSATPELIIHKLKDIY